MDNFATHESAAAYIARTFGKLDILINNAGIARDTMENGTIVPPSKTTLDVFRTTFDTNFFHVIALTQTLLPLVRKSDAGRLVFLSSGLALLTLHSEPDSPFYHFKPTAYDLSKRR